MNKPSRIGTIASCFGMVVGLVTILGFLFGTNIFENIFGHAVFKKDIVPLDGSHRVYADQHWWLFEDNTQAVNYQPNIIYCLADVNIANPEEKMLYIRKLSSTITSGTSEITLETQNGYSSLYKEPLPEFSCIETSLLTADPEVRGIPVPKIPTAIMVTATPGVPGDIPIFDFELEGDFIIEEKPAAVDQCSADPASFYERVRLISVPPEEAITINKDQPTYQLYLLTTFYVKPYLYQYFRMANTGATPVNISHSLIDLNGNSVELGPYDCFFSASK